MAWDVVNSVIGAVIGTVVAGPIGGALGAATGGLLTDSDEPEQQFLPTKFPPYPGTVPGVPPYPVVPPPGPPPGAPSGDGSAHDAADADSAAIGDAVSELAELDAKSAAALAAIEAAGAAGQQALQDVSASVDTKIAELGPRLDSPQGQQELRDFLKDKLGTAKRILDEQDQIAVEKARELQRIADRFSEIGHDRSDGGNGSATTVPGPEPGPGGADLPADPATSTGTAPASSTAPAAATPAAGMGGFPAGLGGMLPSAGMPALGGGLPGAGLTDPLSTLTALGAHRGEDPKFTDDAASAEEPKLADADSAGGEQNRPSAHEDLDSTKADEDPAVGGDAGVHSAVPEAAAADGAPDDQLPSTEVRLPDGTTAQAPSAQAADAVRAAVGGASVSDAYQQAGITVPPAGSPVLDPIPPGSLRAGDVGMWKDHLVLALGDGKVLVSGQVQPLSSVGSGPDFLGWLRPAPGDPPATSAGATPTPPPPPES